MRYDKEAASGGRGKGIPLPPVLPSPNALPVSLVRYIMAHLPSVPLSAMPKSSAGKTVRISFSHPLTAAALAPGFAILSCTGQEARVIQTASVLLEDAISLMHHGETVSTVSPAKSAALPR